MTVLHTRVFETFLNSPLSSFPAFIRLLLTNLLKQEFHFPFLSSGKRVEVLAGEICTHDGD